jgi:hypothetical protein
MKHASVASLRRRENMIALSVCMAHASSKILWTRVAIIFFMLQYLLWEKLILFCYLNFSMYVDPWKSNTEFKMVYVQGSFSL